MLRSCLIVAVTWFAACTLSVQGRAAGEISFEVEVGVSVISTAL